ncbi:MAG: hypothetical protein Q9216_001494 [Gyalolechia sp. 2 TL-2023]
MGDTLCGPSNPLQSFQKHAAVDRTLERDRFISRQSPAQGFRTPNPNAGIHDAEFEAFVAGEPVAEPFYHQYEWHSHPVSYTPSFEPQPSLDWALDFQNLHVNETRASPLSPAQFRDGTPLQRGSPGPLSHDHLDLLRRTQPQSFQSQQSRLNQGSTGFAVPAGNFGISYNRYSSSVAEPSAGNRLSNTFSEEAFEKAFNAAHLEIQDQQANTQHQDFIQESEPTAASDTVEDRVDYRIGSDRILDDDLNRPERSNAQEADELARTAGHLLENVKHDQSAKFQESNFLSLMRQLRDKEMKVEGTKIVHVEQSLHPGGPGYPNSMEGLPANEEVERPRPTTSRIRASSVPRQRQDGHLALPTHPGPPAPLPEASFDLESFDFDAFLRDSDGQEEYST